jgi:hypothetical protein
MKPDHVTVLCVLNVCNFRNRTYDIDWVVKLRAMVGRGLSIPHTFIYLTNYHDQHRPINNMRLSDWDWQWSRLHNGWPGWWAKMELFDPTLQLEGRILYLDLDCVITGSLDDIVSFDAPFAIMKKHQVRSPVPPWMKPHTKCGRKSSYKLVHRFNSGCMVWDAGCDEVKRIWDGFDPKMIGVYKGDQDYISEVIPDAATMPDRWFRKLRDNPDEPRPDDDTRVVFCQPVKNDQLHLIPQLKWAADLWTS